MVIKGFFLTTQAFLSASSGVAVTSGWPILGSGSSTDAGSPVAELNVRLASIASTGYCWTKQKVAVDFPVIAQTPVIT